MLPIDFETFYDKDYSLANVPMAQYINDPKFEVIGVCVGDEWFSGTHEETKAWLQQFDWENETVVAHNAMFDGAILEWVFGCKPKEYFCTMMAARPWVVPFTGRANLKYCAEHFGFPPKGDEVVKAKGLRREDFSPAMLRDYGKYCQRDSHLTKLIAQELWPKFPDSERAIIDLTIKKYTRPKLLLDVSELAQRRTELEDDKLKALLAIGNVPSSVLMSNPQFADLLRKHGVKPPTKISPTTGKETWAFSKQDKAFLALRKHPRVGRFIEARLLWKSTIEQTRINTFIELAKAHNNKLAVPLMYAGAHTLRFSGMDKLNLQNLTRGSALRKAIVAPPGHVVIAADLAQIEARILAVLAGQEDLVHAFACGGDVYALFATKLYNRPITKFSDPRERFVGKTAILSLGYQSGPDRFYDAMLNYGVDIDYVEAHRTVDTYRNTYGKVVKLWDTMELAINSMMVGEAYEIGPLRTGKQCLYLPNGMTIFYPNLSRRNSRERVYASRAISGSKVWKTLYGGKLTENVVQALARIVMTTAELRLAKHGLRAALSVHDELVFVVPKQAAERAAKAIKLAMEATVPWMPTLPVECEVNIGSNYMECK